MLTYCWPVATLLFSCNADRQQFVSQVWFLSRCLGNDIDMILTVLTILNKITLHETGLSGIIAIKRSKLIYCVCYSDSFPGAKLKKSVQFLYVTRQRSVNVFKRQAFLRFPKLLTPQGSLWFCVLFPDHCFTLDERLNIKEKKITSGTPGYPSTLNF